MEAGAEPGGRVLVVAEGGHEPLVRALAAEGHEVDTRLPASALGPGARRRRGVRAASGAAVLAALERRDAPAGRAGDRAQRRGAAAASAPACCAPARTPACPTRCIPASCSPRWRARSPSSAAATPSAAEPEGLSDPVTGLGNRRLGERELDLFVARSTRHGHALAAGQAALDGFDALAGPRPARRGAPRRRRAPRAHAAQRRRDRPLGRRRVPDDAAGHRPRGHPPRRGAPAPLHLRRALHGRRRRPSS